MNAYIAAPWDNKKEAAEIRAHLADIGVGCTATWIDLEGDYFAGPPDMEAARDVAELYDADIFMGYIPDPDTSRGGRDTELGMALALGYPIVLIGTRRSVFHWHPDVRHFPSIAVWKQEKRSLLKDAVK